MQARKHLLTVLLWVTAVSAITENLLADLVADNSDRRTESEVLKIPLETDQTNYQFWNEDDRNVPMDQLTIATLTLADDPRNALLAPLNRSGRSSRSNFRDFLHGSDSSRLANSLLNLKSHSPLLTKEKGVTNSSTYFLLDANGANEVHQLSGSGFEFEIMNHEYVALLNNESVTLGNKRYGLENSPPGESVESGRQTTLADSQMFTSVTITSTGNVAGLGSNTIWGLSSSTNPVPEPTGLGLVLAGALLACCRRSRRESLHLRSKMWPNLN